jgi:hypothetical protein
MNIEIIIILFLLFVVAYLSIILDRTIAERDMYRDNLEYYRRLNK